MKLALIASVIALASAIHLKDADKNLKSAADLLGKSEKNIKHDKI